jgi:hypothetical protein
MNLMLDYGPCTSPPAVVPRELIVRPAVILTLNGSQEWLNTRSARLFVVFFVQSTTTGVMVAMKITIGPLGL